MRGSMRFSMLACVIAACTLTACSAPAPPASEQAQAQGADTTQVTADTSSQPARSTGEPAPGEAAAPVAPEVTPAAFVDKVWRVKSSSAVEADTVYAFLADGTLVIDSPNGTPMHGQWRFEGGKLTMVEEGQSYPTDILRLDASELHLRSHNPGTPVDIVLTLAPNEPLPKAK
ncbi:hypothetical protein L3D22_18575 [Lysobacter soli]|uniref:hypothetical protein n=1 Tax=Lysobacter soli TaxID=453783 RepID=UPI00209FD30B|nr:hypothetical protein [Lysobacter soli]UTA54269.1 hypothetical protein L3D22_18575 [Lysobacter soli]